MLSNFNKPRPRWASATSKLLRTASVIVASSFFAAGSIEGVFITALANALADFILDLFPNNNEQQP